MNQLQWTLHAQTRSFERKLERSRLMIQQAFSTGRKFYASVSFGKDSSVMLRLICDIQPTIPVLYLRSGYALPDTDAYIEEIRHAWQLNLIVQDAPVDYWELCQTFGLPHLRTQSVQKRIVRRIKKDQATQWAVSNDFNGVFWGLRADESLGRKALMRWHPNGVVDRYGILRVAPLAAWTAQDVWAYIFATGMPYNRLYDHENCGFTRETLRNTGWLSTDGAANGQIEWLRRNYPEQFRKVRELL